MSAIKVPKLGIVDPSSYSNPEKIVITNMELFLDIDFEKLVLSGEVRIKCMKQENIKTNHLVLDIKDLKIEKVINLSNDKNLEFHVGERFEEFGSSLCITLPTKEGDDNTYNISITYETSPEASGLQWLTPEQTLGKQAPFVFSQCQAIHCRSIVPCQDTPAVKFPYKAEITAPKDLTVLMGALKTEEPVPVQNNKLLWKFAQVIPIPSYLMAIVAGRLKGKIIGSKSRVYCEPEIMKECLYEFAEADKMLTTAIKVCGPYVWNRCDLLVLPPSFSYGGMENPCLTFITPTILAGDRSLVNVVAHEISHSWTGNLVTNTNFEHFWLNEGFTTYIERKIIGLLHGEPLRHFHAILGFNLLRQTVVNVLGESNPLTALVPNLKKTHPDDAFSIVPYEKGHTLLFYLETLLNEEGMFNKFLQNYLDKFKYQSINTEDFKAYLYEFFKNKKDVLDSVDWNTWFYCPGMPPVIPDYDRSMVNEAEGLATKWRDWVPTEDCLFGSIPFDASEIDSLNSDQKCWFLTQLLNGDPLSVQKLKLMQQVYKLDDIRNSEIKCLWLRLCLKGKWKDIIHSALKFVNEQGRMKFLRPIYRDFYNWEEVRQLAIDNFLHNRKYMMSVTANQVERDLHLNEIS